MDFIEEDDMMEGPYGEEFAGEDQNAARREARHLRGPNTPLDVLFSVFLDQAPKPGETVVLRGTLTELAEGVPMQPCESGNGRLWRTRVQINLANPANAAASAAGGFLGTLGGVLGGQLRGSAPTLSLFEAHYVIQGAGGQTVRQEDHPVGEPGPLKAYYFHRARFTAGDTDKSDEAFPLFFHDEVHLLQSGTISPQEFLARFQQLAQAPFARRRALLDVALEELITVHWGMDARPPTQIVLAIAATLGYFRRQQNHGPSFSPIYDDPGDMLSVLGSSSAVPSGLAEKEREREPPQSLIVCRWIVQHCPTRDAVEEEEGWGEREHPRNRHREEHGHLGSAQLRRYTQLGVLQAAETLYIGEKTFEWLKLLNFLPEHALPPPLNASQFSGSERDKLVRSFISAMDEVFSNFRRQQQNAQQDADNDARPAGEGQNATSLETFLRGLISFCPSVDSLHRLIMQIFERHEAQLEVITPMVWHRLRSLHFGPQDKDALKTMIRAIPFMASDNCAIALLTNQHHPNDAFTHAEIIQFIKLVALRPAGPQLQSATRRWLMRYYGRPPDRPDQRKDEKPPLSKMSRADYLAQKEEIRDAIQKAIRGWDMVLALECFRTEEETLRMILFELSQAYFFKDPDPLLVLDCMLDLERDICNVSVKQLELELQRIANRSVRDAQDTSETEHHDELFRLLFETPTPLRFVIIEAFIGIRQAAVDLNKLLANEPIWSRLLSPTWVNARGIAEYQLGQTQRSGQTMLQQSATQLTHSTISLKLLHTILSYQKSYEKLITLVPGDTPSNIPQSAARLHKFDNEFKQLRTYVKMFCAAAQVEATSLEQLIESIRVGYDTLELQVAVSKFEGLPVRPHLPWLQSLKGSDVFLAIWKDVARSENLTRDGQPLRQEDVVLHVIPKARASWERLAKSIETGTAVLKDIRWCVELQWAKVQLELELLESSTGSGAARWVPVATDLTKAMRLAAKLREWAPSMLELRDVLGELFASVTSDFCVEELKAVVKHYEHFWDMRLEKMIEQVEPYKDTINMLSEAMQEYTILAAKHDKSLRWLVKHKSTEDFNRLLSLCRPNTDDALILGAIASLQQTRTFLAEALYTKPPYRDLRAFLEELAGLVVDETTQASLQSVQTHFDPLLDLLTTHSRTPGVQACYDLKKIYESGEFLVICSAKESEQLVCAVPDGEFNYEALAELRRQLLMTDVPSELDGATNIHEMLDQLVAKFSLLEEYGRCAMELYQLGHFAYQAGQRVMSVPPRDSVESVQNRLKELQQKLMDWKAAVDTARGRHYFLNYFTVRELCHLVEHLPQIGDVSVWNRLWPLLRCVDLNADSGQVRAQLSTGAGRLGQLAANGRSEVDMLNALGKMLDELFQPSAPNVRRLDGLRPVRQQLQGDLLIRSMQNREQGVPVFVCCADEPSKVTELVLSIYTRRERVPEAEELLLCSSNTTLEEIELLLRRFFSARQHKREDRLYCLGNIHLLPYVIQCGTVEALRHLEERFGFTNASALVFVSGQPNQMLTNALNRHNLAVSVLPHESLMEAVSRVGEKYHGRQMEAVAAQMNGVGKTHYIYRQVHQLQDKYGGQPILHHVEIRETTNISALVQALLSDPTDPAVPTAIHIDLAHILPSHVDTLLFELLIVGTLRDPQHCTVYHRRSQQDFFFVEIPNTLGEATAKQLSFCLLLPRIFLRMNAERVDSFVPRFKPVGNAVMIEFAPNDKLEIVGKTLAAMRVEAFNPKSKDFNVTWVGRTAPVVDPKEVYNLLLEVCCSETSPPSFLVFNNFINFLGNLVTCAEEWNMLNLQLLQNFDPGLKHFKHCFFRLLIETSRDFALRQVPKSNLDLLENSPLQPRIQQQAFPGRGGGRAQPAEQQPPPPQPAAAAAAAAPAGEAASSSNAPARPRGANEVPAADDAGIGRPDVAAYVARFDQMPSWESCVHPIASFKKNENGAIVGCSIMSLQRNFLGNFIGRELQTSLNLNNLKLEKDWSKVTHAEAVQLVHHIEGGELLRNREHLNGPKDYVVTVDNLLKFMSIQQRLKYGLPVILMGETGCGKTALVKFLAKTLDFRLFTLDIHGGITDDTIINFISDAIKQAHTSSGVLVFFDEINAANCMALFKTIIIDRMYGSTHIPDKVRIIACCNPYRRRRNNEVEEVALVFQHHANEQQGASGISDPMKRLVYRVHPLPESLVDVVSDFGALSEKSEEIYIDAILHKELPRLEAPEAAEGEGQGDDENRQAEYDVFLGAFRELLCQSQIFVRDVNFGERSVVSMRDIARAARVFKWFLTYYSRLRNSVLTVSDDRDGAMRIDVTADMKPHLRSAIILTLGYCYHSRLNREHRFEYRRNICNTWIKMNQQDQAVGWLKLDSASDLEEKLTQTQYEFVAQMELGDGIALNEALRENLFMLLVSVMNQIPILLIGKPGCSKSLAMGVLQNNLNGEVSNKEFFKTMPAVEVFAYQCSPLSTPEAILSAFQSARQSNLGHKSTIVCVLLDEVGLAEESPHLPLKVLHKELEDLQGIACVGISNWALDAAKMSRCVTLYRPPPTVEDLCVTAEGMVASSNLKAYLTSLSEAFFQIYKSQKRPDFWGMREFYSTVRVINAELKLRASRGQEAVVEPQVLMKTVQRNFGGQPEAELERCIEEFFDRVSMSYKEIPRYTTSELIQQNLSEPDARHLMLLTKNNAALRLLFESSLLDHNKAEVMFGSTFPNDQSDVFVAMNLQRIKSFMQQPISLVMVHCDSLYESLYDLLNQHYMEYAGQRYVRIAHGSKAKQCPIHPLFRVIVITEISDAYFRLAPPLLNRFEKQIFLRKDLMARADEALLKKMSKFWELLLESVRGTGTDHDTMEDEEEAQDAVTSKYNPIAGYHPELLSSLVFTLRRRSDGAASIDDLFAEARQLLTWVLTPEAVCIAAARYGPRQMQLKFGFDIVHEYFHNQRHSDLPSYAQTLVEDERSWCDVSGSQVMVMTYSPIRGKIGQDLQKTLPVETTELSLHELSSSHDIEKEVREFYARAQEPRGKPTRRFLLIHADPAAASLRMIEHCRFVCEKSRNEFTRRLGSLPPAERAAATGNVFVILVVHLQRGSEGSFSFDFDSQWRFVFLDSVEPSTDLNQMPALGSMLNMPLIEVVKGLDFPKLLKKCFRSSLSRLIYPHSRKPEDLQRQIQQILLYLEDKAFIGMVRDWTLRVLEQTPKNAARESDGTVGDDKNWFAAIATAAHELALAGTFRAALHNRINGLVGSLLTVLLAHLDRNGGLALLSQNPKRELWISLSTASLTSPLSARLQHEAVTAINEAATAQHEVGTDAQTGARPFPGRFPSSWFVSRSIDGVRHIIESLPPREQLPSLVSQYQMSKLHEVGLQPAMDQQLLDDYISDFTAMHVDWAPRINREIQQQILRKTIQRIHGSELTSILEVHQLFWNAEKRIAYCNSLLNAVPDAVPGAAQLIDTADAETVNLDLMFLVHQTLTGELTNTNTREVPHTFYQDWQTRKMVVAGLTKDLIASLRGVQHEKLTRLKTDTEPRIETLGLMLQHIAHPLKLPLDIVRQFLQDLPDGKVRHTRTFHAILKLAQRIEGFGGGLRMCSDFIESWVLDVCLRDAEAISDLDGSCLRLFCSLSAGLPVVLEPNTINGVVAGSLEGWHEQDDSPIFTLPGRGGGVIPRSPCLNLALLRKLIVRSDGDAKRLATNRIEDLLGVVSKHERHNDTTMATKYAVLCEEAAAVALARLPRPDDWPELSLQEVFNPKGGSPALMLQDIGRIRWMLTQYAKVLCTDPIDMTHHDAILRKVDPLLQTTNDGLAQVCRSMRLYLLKCIERVKGISSLRGMLAEPPLCEAKWVIRWRDLHDIDFYKFIGAALVPKWNPFTGMDETPEYAKAKVAVIEMMNSTATVKLDQFAQDCSAHPLPQQKRDIGGLLMALCQEPGLLAALQDEDRQPAWRHKLNDWLATTRELPVNDQERALLRVFAGDDAILRGLRDPDNTFLKPFSVAINRKMEQLLRWRLLGHLAGALIAAPPASLLSALRKLMLEPGTLMPAKNSIPIFLPGMDEDIRNRVMKALLERGENIWKFKSHWYKCSCGYTFFIGECGRPMEVTSCPGCGTAIGGRDHNKTSSTIEDDETDRSPFGYMLPTADKDDKHISFRDLPSTSARAVRLLLHGSMYCGLVAHASLPMPRIFDSIVNKDSMCTMHQDIETKYISEHFANDWQNLVENLSSNCEDLAAALHALLKQMSDERRDEMKGTAASSGERADLSWERLQLPMRNNWEEVVESKYLGSMVMNYDSSLGEIYKKWGGAEEDGKFVSELKEAADVRDFPIDKREAELPQLWAYRSPVTLDALHARLGVLPSAQESFPVLCTVLQQPLFPVLKALGCLTGVFEWHSLAMTHFSGRITRTDAGNLKVGDFLAGLQPTERKKWETAYEQFERAWHIAWRYVERHECFEISENLKKVMISRESEMVWCIADSTNEGICPLALTQWLVERHNELVQVVSAAIGYPPRKVSSRLLGQNDVVTYDEHELMRFLQTRCVTYGVGGKLNFDFKQLEQQLRRELARPEITVEIKSFQWLGETFSAMHELRTVVKQRELSPEVIERLKAELTSPSLANLCLQKVQMSVSFILKSGGALSVEHAGEMLLSEYLRSVLSESPDSLPSAAARSEVHLWHVDSFAKLLRQIINKDPMDAIDPKYKAKLTDKLEARMMQLKPRIPSIFLDVLATTAEARLTDSYIGDETSMADMLKHLKESDEFEVDSATFDAILDDFPQDLKMKHWAAVYCLLKQA